MKQGKLCASEGFRRVFIYIGLFTFCTVLPFCDGAELSLSNSSEGVWHAGVGEGFRKGANELSLSAGPGQGMEVFGSQHRHDWWLLTFEYGRMLSNPVGEGHWYHGNWELLVSVFGGEQYKTDHAFLAGGGPHLRYDFANGTRAVPFIDVGAGVTATDIRGGDLSTTFEFNLQAGLGVHLLITDNLAATVQGRLIHISNAGIDYPNLGANSITFLAGLTWFF
jgi:lipid A 3-O-deacylase